MKKYIIITADTNDGDYVNRKEIISDENIELIKPICKILKKDSSWGAGELLEDDNDPNRYIEQGLLTKEQIKLFERYIPYGEYGIHSIESVEILVVQEEFKLL